jgi:uncharacterized repeat protein (TIGR01451 family)
MLFNTGRNVDKLLKNDGTVWVWGADYSGQLGLGRNITALTPVSSIAPGSPDLSLTMTHAGNYKAGDSAVYSLTVTNSGLSATLGTITVTDILPAGLTLVSATGSGWNCSAISQTVTCTNAGPIAAGASTVITLTATIGSLAYPGVTNSATVSNSSDLNQSNNTGGDPVIIAKRSDGVGAFGSGYWVQDANGNFAWDGTSVDRLIYWSLGQTGEIPVYGDWNGDGKTKIGLYINGTWYLDFNGNGVWDGPNVDKLVYFGGPGFAPYVGDWNGSGTGKMAVHKDGTWMIDFNGNFAWDGPGTDKLIFFGGPGYTPMVGDWNGSGTGMG